MCCSVFLACEKVVTNLNMKPLHDNNDKPFGVRTFDFVSYLCDVLCVFSLQNKATFKID